MFIPIPIKAKYFVLLYGAAELFFGLQNSVGDNVAHFAHLGGMLFGFFLILYWRKHSKKFYYKKIGYVQQGVLIEFFRWNLEWDKELLQTRNGTYPPDLYQHWRFPHHQDSGSILRTGRTTGI